MLPFISKTNYYDQVQRLPYDDRLHFAALDADSEIYSRKIALLFVVSFAVGLIACLRFGGDPFMNSLMLAGTATWSLACYRANKRTTEAESNIQNMLRSVQGDFND